MYEYGDEDLFFYNNSELLPNKKNTYSIHISEGEKEKSIVDSQTALESFNNDYGAFIELLNKSNFEFEIKHGVISYYY